MALSVTHSTPSDGTFSGSGAAAWDAVHAISGTIAASDVTGLATVATSGLYSDLSGTPTLLSQFTNDANFITSAGAPVQSVNGYTGVVVLAKSDVGLGNVTNHAQTQAAIVPNTAPSAGQVLAGNAGGTAYAPVSISGDGSLSSAGALTVTKTNGVSFATIATSGSGADLTAASVTYAKIQNISATSRILGRITAGAGTIEELTAANVKTILALTSSDVGLGNVTNDTQTKAAIVPNTAPSAGQVLAGNAGGTAYAPVTLSGSGATVSLSSAGVVTISSIANASLANSSITIAGTSTALGGSITQDTITGLSSTGIIKRTGANTLAVAVAGTDYEAAIAAGTSAQYWRGDKTWQTLNATAVGLGSVTNNAQTQAAIVPNTAPSAGQILAGNAGGTAYAPVTMSGGATMDSTGAVTLSFAGKTTGDLTEGANLYFTDERAQDAVGLILVDGNTVNFTYNDGTPSITAEVITQMSITSDASGVKLSGDSASPGNSKYYGTNSSGTKGFHAIPAGTGDVIADDVSTTVQNIVAYNSTDGLHVTELTGTQGDVLYHNGTNWAKLAAGTSGHYLKTQGAAANPTWAAVSGGGGPTFPGGIPLTGVSFPKVFGSNLATGDTDLYTVPAGKRAVVLSSNVYNTSAGNISWYTQIKISGTYYRMHQTVTTGTGASQVNNGLTSYICEAGEVIAINTATNNGTNVWYRIVLFDDSCKIFSAKLTSLANGDNTVYTVPSSTTAQLLDISMGLNVAVASLLYVNSSGASRTIYWNIVPSGGSPGSTNQISAATSVSNLFRSTIGGMLSLDAGDFVNINTNASTATQMAWVNVMEI